MQVADCRRGLRWARGRLARWRSEKVLLLSTGSTSTLHLFLASTLLYLVLNARPRSSEEAHSPQQLIFESDGQELITIQPHESVELLRQLLGVPVDSRLDARPVALVAPALAATSFLFLLSAPPQHLNRRGSSTSSPHQLLHDPVR